MFCFSPLDQNCHEPGLLQLLSCFVQPSLFPLKLHVSVRPTPDILPQLPDLLLSGSLILPKLDISLLLLAWLLVNYSAGFEWWIYLNCYNYNSKYKCKMLHFSVQMVSFGPLTLLCVVEHGHQGGFYLFPPGKPLSR